MNASVALVADALLQWIYAQDGGARGEYVDLTEFCPHLDPNKVDEARTSLEGRKLITVDWDTVAYLIDLDTRMIHQTARLQAEHPGIYIPPWRGPAGPMVPPVQLTAKGIAKAEQSYHRWGNRAFRNRAARDRLLAWVYDQVGPQQIFIPIHNFVRSSKSIVEGYFLSLDDVDGAVQFLSGHDLVEAPEGGGRSGGFILRLTSHGIDCLEQGGSVAEYLNSRQSRENTGNHLETHEYNIRDSQIGAVGPDANVSGNDFRQFVNVAEQFPLDQLAQELSRLRNELVERAALQSTPEHYVAIGEVSGAELAARKGDRQGVWQHLARVGKWALDIANQIGVSVAVEAIKAVFKAHNIPVS